MGLFGKKLKIEDHDEAHDLPSISTVVSAPVPLTNPKASSLPTNAPVAAASRTVPGAEGPRLAYGIEDAVRLLRTLPVDRSNSDLVARVVKQTLESMNVRIADIISDAERKEKAAQELLTSYRSDIAELEAEIQLRREEIQKLETELSETSNVKQRLRSTEAPASPKVVVAVA